MSPPRARTALALALITSLAFESFGAPIVTTLDASSPGFVFNRRSSMVRDVSGTLWCVHVREEPNGDRPVRVASSIDGGVTWTLDPFVFNDASSGLTNAWNSTNACAVAIDSQGTLHVLWARYHYPSYFQQYYRSYRPPNQATSPIVDVTANVAQSTTGNRTDALAIAVDEDDFVWMTASGKEYWKDRLWRSAWPNATGQGFVEVGEISSNTNTVQETHLAVDAQGNVHCVFFSNYQSGTVTHREYDPGAGAWATENFVLGDTDPQADHFPLIATDALGGVHCVYTRETIEPNIEYRHRQGGTWSAPVPIASFTVAQTGAGGAAMFGLGCDETTGRVFVALRDYAAQGAFVLMEKPPGAATFGPPIELLSASATKNEYYGPSFLGSLHPWFNRSGSAPALTLRRGGAAPFELLLLAPHGPTDGVFTGDGCPGSGGHDPRLSATASGLYPGSTLTLTVSEGLGGGACHFFFGTGPGSLPMAGGCTLNVWPVFPVSIAVPLGGVGAGNGTVVLSGVVPASLSGTDLHTQIFCVDPGVPHGFSNSRGLHLSFE